MTPDQKDLINLFKEINDKIHKQGLEKGWWGEDIPLGKSPSAGVALDENKLLEIAKEAWDSESVII